MMDNASFHYMERLEQMCLAFIKKTGKLSKIVQNKGSAHSWNGVLMLWAGREGSAKSHLSTPG
jgi:hypothetical protein